MSENSKLRRLETLFIIAASISLLMSSLVLLTALAFRSMRRKLFMQIITFIAICDIFTSGASLVGFPADGTPACSTQAFLISFFVKGMWLWTTVLCYQLYAMFQNGKVSLSYPAMHGIVWGISLVTTLLPLSTGTFGRQGPNERVEWCFLTAKDRTWYIVWQTVDWLAVIQLCLLVLAVLLVQWIIVMRDSTRRAKMSPRLISVMNSLYLYPMAMVLSWSPTMIANICIFYIATPIVESSYVLSLAGCLAVSNGTFQSLIFFYKSHEAQMRWKFVFIGILQRLGFCQGIARTVSSAQSSAHQTKKKSTQLHINSSSSSGQSSHQEELSEDDLQALIHNIPIDFEDDEYYIDGENPSGSGGGGGASGSSTNSRVIDQAIMNDNDQPLASKLSNSPFHAEL